ncbi:MAG: hypothetical protein ABJ056_06415 [Halioglobus sp.]
MSLFRVIKYSSILFFLGKYKSKLFRVIAVLLFAMVTSLLYQDLANYLAQQHPDTLIYALIGKIAIVYGSLVFVLWQFRPEPDTKNPPLQAGSTSETSKRSGEQNAAATVDRLSQLEDLDTHQRLRTRYEQMLEKEKKG